MICYKAPRQRTLTLLVAQLVSFLITSAPADPIPFSGEFRIPALKTIWKALGEPTDADLELEWQEIDPTKDVQLPDDFWRHWPAPFSPFYAGVKLPAESFTLAQLYQNDQLLYPQAVYDPNVDFVTFYDLHTVLAWLYAFDSPANPFHKKKALGLRARQLALIHLAGMTQQVPGGNIIGGYAIQYGNCLAWSAHTLELLDATVALDAELRAAWIDCLHHIATTLDAQGPGVLQTGMGHWNLWPVVGAFFLSQVSDRGEHKALFDKWAETQLQPDRFTSKARYVSGTSPVGYVRYSGVDLGYNGQAKNWIAPLFERLGLETTVGDFARRQYQFASYVSVEEPTGNLAAPQHMNSHSWNSPPYEQWSAHRHLSYAAHIPDAVPFARRAGYDPSRTDAKPRFAQDQAELKGRKIKVLPPMPFGVRSYPSNYLHLPPSLAFYPKKRTADLQVRTRPQEHLAYAKFFRSPVVRDEWLTRRTPAYHATLFSGPCREEASNYGGTLNGIGAGGLSHLWVADAGTMLLAYSELSQKPAINGDFETVWSQLAINALVGVTGGGKVLCSGWTGSLVGSDASPKRVAIANGTAPAVEKTYRTPMSDAMRWSRTLEFHDRQIEIGLSAHANEVWTKLYELVPVALFDDTKISAAAPAGDEIPAPWTGAKQVTSIRIRRAERGVELNFAQPLHVSWGSTQRTIESAVGQAAKVQAMQIDVLPLAASADVTFRYTIRYAGPEVASVVRVHDGLELPRTRLGQNYALALEANDARALYWRISAGALPMGLTLDRAGLLAGVPRERGTFTLTIGGETPYKSRPFFEEDFRATAVKLIVD